MKTKILIEDCEKDREDYYRNETKILKELEEDEKLGVSKTTKERIKTIREVFKW